MDPQIEQKIAAFERPPSKLLTLYFIRSLSALIMFPVVFVPLYCKYITLRYHFDSEGVGASWGVLFKRQVYLTYARIQDIQVTRGLIERWLGIGTVDLQTASGSATAELSIVGFEEYDAIRDYLYSKMRGVRGESTDDTTGDEVVSQSEALHVLTSIRDELRLIRESLHEGGESDV